MSPGSNSNSSAIEPDSTVFMMCSFILCIPMITFHFSVSFSLYFVFLLLQNTFIYPLAIAKNYGKDNLYSITYFPYVLLQHFSHILQTNILLTGIKKQGTTHKSHTLPHFYSAASISSLANSSSDIAFSLSTTRKDKSIISSSSRCGMALLISRITFVLFLLSKMLIKLLSSTVNIVFIVYISL